MKKQPPWIPKDSHECQRSAIPVYHTELKRISRILQEYRTLGLILIEASSLRRIEDHFGKKVYRDILQLLNRVIEGIRGVEIRREDIITVNREGGDEFLIFLTKKRDAKEFYSTDLEGMSQRISKAVNERIFNAVFPYLKGKPNITVGYAIVIYNPLIQEESLINRLIEDAKTMARFQKFKEEIRNKEKIQELILKEQIKILFQPIMELKSRRVVGYEALSRGPEGTEYENPYFLFDIAKEVGLIFELDRLCRKKALQEAVRLDHQAKLFINCLPTTIHDPEFKGAYLREFLADVHRSPHNVVMELSEREAINDYQAFREAMSHYSELGFAIAVDDAGAGYSSLEAIVELQPSYLKLDISMVRGIHDHLLKQEMIKAMAAFSQKIKAQIIAEGIETQKELDILIELGVPLGQGFLLGRPADPPVLR